MTRFCGDIKPIFPFGPPENVRKPFGFLIFSEGPKWKHGFNVVLGFSPTLKENVLNS